MSNVLRIDTKPARGRKLFLGAVRTSVEGGKMNVLLFGAPGERVEPQKIGGSTPTKTWDKDAYVFSSKRFFDAPKRVNVANPLTTIASGGWRSSIEKLGNICRFEGIRG